MVPEETPQSKEDKKPGNKGKKPVNPKDNKQTESKEIVETKYVTKLLMTICQKSGVQNYLEEILLTFNEGRI